MCDPYAFSILLHDYLLLLLSLYYLKLSLKYYEYLSYLLTISLDTRFDTTIAVVAIAVMEVPNIIAEEGLNVDALDVLLFKAILDLTEPTIQTH